VDERVRNADAVRYEMNDPTVLVITAVVDRAASPAALAALAAGARALVAPGVSAGLPGPGAARGPRAPEIAFYLGRSHTPAQREAIERWLAAQPLVRRRTAVACDPPPDLDPPH